MIIDIFHPFRVFKSRQRKRKNISIVLSSQNPSEINDFRGIFLFFVYCGAGFELSYAFSLYSRFPWPASTTTIPSSASCCMRDSVRLKLVPRDLESENRSLVGWSVR